MRINAAKALEQLQVDERPGADGDQGIRVAGVPRHYELELDWLVAEETEDLRQSET